MNHYVTGNVIRQLREQAKLTQAQLAGKLCVSDKAVSNGRPAGGFRTSAFWSPWRNVLASPYPNCSPGSPSATRTRAPIFCGPVFMSARSAAMCCGPPEKP